MKTLLLTTTIILAAATVRAESGKLVLAALNPIAADLAREVGGERVELIELMDNSQDPHSFRPDPDDLRAARRATIFLAMGKGLETYLQDIEDALGEGQTIYELGRMVPSLRSSREQAMFSCCPLHAGGGAIDPHWWHSPPRVRKAVQLLGRRLGYADPDGADYYKERAESYADELQELDEWARQKLGAIPSARRILTSSHAAFNYLCSEYDIKSMPINGLSSMEEPKPSELAEIVATIRKEQLPAVFPEVSTSDKMLAAIAQETGVRIGQPLYAGTLPPDDPTYLGMIRFNVESIAAALQNGD